MIYCICWGWECQVSWHVVASYRPTLLISVRTGWRLMFGSAVKQKLHQVHPPDGCDFYSDDPSAAAETSESNKDHVKTCESIGDRPPIQYRVVSTQDVRLDKQYHIVLPLAMSCHLMRISHRLFVIPQYLILLCHICQKTQERPLGCAV